MERVIKKWGSSPAVRRDSAVVRIAARAVEQQATNKASKEIIIVESSDKLNFDINVLVACITRANLHDKIDFGRCAGKEIL